MFIRDLFSRNGTIVNGTRIKRGGARRLRVGDRFCIGKFVFHVQLSDGDHRNGRMAVSGSFQEDREETMNIPYDATIVGDGLE